MQTFSLPHASVQVCIIIGLSFAVLCLPSLRFLRQVHRRDVRWHRGDGFRSLGLSPQSTSRSRQRDKQALGGRVCLATYPLPLAYSAVSQVVISAPRVSRALCRADSAPHDPQVPRQASIPPHIEQHTSVNDHTTKNTGYEYQPPSISFQRRGSSANHGGCGSSSPSGHICSYARYIRYSKFSICVCTTYDW